MIQHPLHDYENVPYKVRRILELDLIYEDAPGEYICAPLPGNKLYHSITPIHYGWKCTCQGWRKKEAEMGRGDCSHCKAVREYKRRQAA